MFLYSKWLKTAVSTRFLLAEKLGIKRTLPIHVSDNYVVQDGFAIQDVENIITVENLQNITGSGETDLEKLFDIAVAIVEGHDVQASPEVINVETEVKVEEPKEILLTEPKETKDEEPKKSDEVKRRAPRGTKTK